MFKNFLTIMIIVVLSGNIYSQVRKVTLVKCIKVALENHPDIYISKEDNKQAYSSYKITKSQQSIQVSGAMKTVEYLKPTASANSAFNIPGQDTDVGLFAGLTAVYNLYDVRTEMMEETARSGIIMSKIKYNQISTNIILNVKIKYYGYIFASETLDLRKKLLRKYIRKLKQVKMFFDSGTRSILDVTKTELALSEAKLEFEKAKNNRSLAKIQLLISMGIKDNDSLKIEIHSLSKFPKIKYSLHDLHKLGEMYNPSIKLIKIQKEIVKSKIKVQRAAHIPRVDFLMALGYENKKMHGIDKMSQNFDNGNWSPTFHGAISASLPVYTGGAISESVNNAISDYNKAFYRERSILMQVKGKISVHFKTLNELLKQNKMSKLMVRNSKKHLLLAQRSYENGVGSQIELNDAEMGVLKAEFTYITVKNSYFTNLAALSNIVGIAEDKLCEK
jgi:outer membrane protein